jgi:hypothetical protein
VIKYHTISSAEKIAEIMPGKILISEPGGILDLMAEAGMNDCSKLIIHSGSLHPDFFDLKTKLAGEILQKFSNYRMKLAIIGDFSDIKSKSLRDFIRESNRTGIIAFVSSLEEALGF